MENRSNAKLAFGIATFIVSAAIILSAIFADKWLNSLALQVWITFGGILFASWGITYAVLLFPATYADWWGHMAYAEAKRTEAYTAKLGRGENVTKSVTNETETKTALTREEAARAFWIEACRVAEATGNPGWRNGYKNFLSSDKDWQTWIKAPLVAQRFAIPKNTGNGETIIWREGIDPRYVRGWLSANLLPLPPEGWPPVWRKPQTADTKDSGNTGEYSTDTADTVYAKDV